MRKIMIFGLALFGAVSMWAQQNEGKFGMELLFNPFSDDFETFKMSELKGRYFLNEKSAVRFGIGFGIDNTTTTDTESFNNKFDDDVNSYTISNKETETKINKSSLKLSLGYEHHVFTKGRFDVYLGGELGWEGKFFSGEKDETTNEESKQTNGTNSYTTTTRMVNSHYEYEKMTPNNEYNESRFFVNAFTGVDFYIYKGLYIGTELGISFSNGKSLNGTYTHDYSEDAVTKHISVGRTDKETYVKKTSYSSETGMTIGEESRTYSSNSGNNYENDIKQAGNVTDYESSNTKLEIYVEPALRIGWRF